MSELELSQILKARLHLTLAQAHLPGSLRHTNTTLIAWLNALSVGPALTDGKEESLPQLDFEAAVTADFRRLTWRAAGTPSLMAVAMPDFFDKVGIKASATATLEKLVAEVKPPLLGAWVEATAQSSDVDTGWYIPKQITLATALEIAQELAPESRTPAKLATWAEAMGAEYCVRIGHSVAPGNPFTELRIVLPGQNVDEWVLAGVRLFDALGVVDLPDDALGALLNATTQEMLASVWFTTRGVVKTGILVAKPDLDLTLSLFRMATGVQQAAEYSPLAELQGNLQVNGPTWAEAQQRASGFGVEYHYAIPA
jgi:hypothetical protein